MIDGTKGSMDVDISCQQPLPHSPAAPLKLPSRQNSAVPPNLSKPTANNILTDIHIHDVHKLAMEGHFKMQAEQGCLPENIFDIPGDLTSIQMGMLGDAARIGNRHDNHVLHFVSNVEKYFKRTALHVMKDIENDREELTVEQAIGKEAESLMEDLISGLI